ncbi:Transcription factor bhlh isoform x1 [Thalictrum thalictroides]|uniref:Transcription factor bhlh isoform x1 n=1 Tax=Thalictrum thalictroides TaxID=46969 RepID=A0A7J6W5T3_THATH|nr:Transcription factor bhlh isoform x1 [Thalictrum thalictroides]
MEMTSLRQFLRSLCEDLQWDYTVFWKVRHRSRMLLTWEDGYCNYPKPRQYVEGNSDNVHLGEIDGVASFDYEIDVANGSSAGYPLGLAVVSMSCALYSLGEGYVGGAASTGKHHLIFADEFDSKLLPEV